MTLVLGDTAAFPTMADAEGIFSECFIAFVPSAQLAPKLISSVRVLTCGLCNKLESLVSHSNHRH